MNSVMIGHTKRLAFKLMLTVTLFTILATSLAALQRYRDSLDKLLANHQTIKQNLTKMRVNTIELRNTITSFKHLLPAGFESRSVERLLYTRLDEAKGKLPLGELQVKPLETRDGMISVDFQFKQDNPSYSHLLNTIGNLETSIFPFVNIKSISIDGDSKYSSGTLSIEITGEISTMAPPQTEADTSAPVQKPVQPKGGR